MLAHPWDQNVIDLALSQLANMGLTARLSVFHLIANRDGTLKDELSVTPRWHDVNARLATL